MNYHGYLNHLPTLVTACGSILLLTLESRLPNDTRRRDALRLELFDAGAKQPCPEGAGEEGENNV